METSSLCSIKQAAVLRCCLSGHALSSLTRPAAAACLRPCHVSYSIIINTITTTTIFSTTIWQWRKWYRWV
jgi:hypothetical protein